MAAARAALATMMVALTLTSAAAAKEFRPGDVSICDANRCVPVDSPSVLSGLASFYYDGTRPPAKASAPRLGAPFFRLAFSDGYVTGIVAGADLGSFVSYGVNLDQFEARAWYQVPTRVAAGLERLSVDLAPLRLTQAALTPTNTFGARGPQPDGPARLLPEARGQPDSLLWTALLMVLAVLIAVTLVAIRRPRIVGGWPSRLIGR